MIPGPWFDFRTRQPSKNLCGREQLLLQLEKEWEKKRPGTTPNVFTQAKPGLLKKLRSNCECSKWGRFCACAVAPRMNLLCNTFHFVMLQGQWHEVACGNYKANDTKRLCSNALFLFDPKLGCRAKSASAFRLGGHGLCYVEVRQPDGRVLVPAAILPSPESWNIRNICSRMMSTGHGSANNQSEAYLNPVLVS